MGNSQKVDLLVIGSGPAGLSTALHLVKQAESWADRIVIVEKDSHPRPKLCGGGITRLGLDLLKDLGIAYPLPIPMVEVDDVRLVYSKRTIHVRGKPQFVVVYRSDFDDHLAKLVQEIGVTIHENEEVKSLSSNENYVTVETNKCTYHARAVVGADGSNGITRRYINGPGQPNRVARLLEVITSAPQNAAHFIDRYAHFDFTPVDEHLQGYAWIFPAIINQQPSFNRGVYDARLARQRPRASLPNILSDSMQAHSNEPGTTQLAGHPIHLFTPRNRFSVPRLLLAGDSAGVDPLFGEGISPALAYGKIAAVTIMRAFQTGDFSFRDYRRRVLVSKLGWYLTLRWIIAWTCYHLSGKRRFMRTLWTFGGLLARVWPEPETLHSSKFHE